MHAKVWGKERNIYKDMLDYAPQKPPPTYPMKGIRAAVVRLTYFGWFVFFLIKKAITIKQRWQNIRHDGNTSDKALKHQAR